MIGLNRARSSTVDNDMTQTGQSFPGLAGLFYLCAGLDSNQRRPKSMRLQRTPFDRLGTDAHGSDNNRAPPFPQ
jgi:hypothetical protein